MEITKLELIQKTINLPGDATSFRNYIALEIAEERLEFPLEPMISTDEYVKVFREYLEKIQSKTNTGEISEAAVNEPKEEQIEMFEENKENNG